jgi:hypothetical protein
VTKAKGCLLAREAGGSGGKGGGADLGEDRVFFLGFEGGFEFECLVEVILDDVLVAPGDEHEVLDPRLARLINDVLDRRAVEHRQHFLRHRFGGWQHTRAETGDGEDGLADGLHGKFPTHDSRHDDVAWRTRHSRVSSSQLPEGGYSTVTDFARFRGWSTSVPFSTATW